jgi:hypothetical protein
MSSAIPKLWDEEVMSGGVCTGCICASRDNLITPHVLVRNRWAYHSMVCVANHLRESYSVIGCWKAWGLKSLGVEKLVGRTWAIEDVEDLHVRKHVYEKRLNLWNWVCAYNSFQHTVYVLRLILPAIVFENMAMVESKDGGTWVHMLSLCSWR